MVRWPRLLDYASQVRLFALLLVLLLIALLLGTTYLFGQTKLRLEGELEAKLRVFAKAVSERLRADPGWPPGRAPLSPEVALALLAFKDEAQVSRVTLKGRQKEETLFGLPGPLVVPPALLAEAWGGKAVFSDFSRNPTGGYARTFLFPLQERGRVVGVLAIEARADFLGFLQRIRWVMVAGYGGGLLLAVVLGYLFIRSILKPYALLSSAARDFTALSRVPVTEAEGEIEFVTRTFQKMIDALREQQAELERLYEAERKRARDLESYQEYILGSISSGVISLKPDFTIIVFNRTAQQIFGLSEEEVLGRSSQEVFGENGEITILAEEAFRLKRLHSRLELAVKRRDGTPVWIGLSSSLLRDEEGAIVGLTFLLTDLTEILKLREQVMLKESLATLGQMSAGIAHEFRNSLGTILGFAKLLQKKLPPDDPSSAHVQAIIAECGGLEAVLRDFLAFAKPDQLHLTEVDLPGLVEDCLASHRQALEVSGIRVSLKTPPHDLFIQADPTVLKQAFVNLIRNACEAMPEGGELRVEVKGLREEESHGRWVQVTVADTGPGIPEEDRERIFAPFFTTKEGGTGLGLALVQKAVVAHGGRVEVEGQVGKGSAFTVILPYGERRRTPRL